MASVAGVAGAANTKKRLDAAPVDPHQALRQRSAEAKLLEVPVAKTAGQKFGRRILHAPLFEHLMAVVIILNFVVVILDTDYDASGEDAPVWVDVCSWGVLITFVLELILRVFTYRGEFPLERWNVFDFIIITLDFTMSLIGLFGSGFINLSGLRILRLARLARVTKIVQVFPELRLMLAGLAGAMHAILWGTVLLFTVLLIWAVMAVQFIHPINEELVYMGCERCPRAYESTFQAALTFCQQIVAGDSWGRVTVPVIEESPATGLFFAGVYLSVGLALLNLILGVVVNVATEERERLLAEMAAERDVQRLEAHDALKRMCSEMDEDGNDELTMEEIKHGYDHNEAFRTVLTKMEIGRSDLDIVWTILDSDKSGTITSSEFVTQVYKMKSSDTQFMLAYIKFYITEIKDKLKQDLLRIQVSIDKDMKIIEKDFDVVTDQLREVTESKGEAKKMSLEKFDAGQSRIDETEVKWGAGVADSNLESLASPAIEAESLQLFFDQTNLMKVETEIAAKTGSPAKEHTELLARLHGLWQQCVVSIDDVGRRHRGLTNLLANQAGSLAAVIRHLSGGGKETTSGSAAGQRPLLDGRQDEVKACWVCGHRTATPM
jgi:voltage-gated sodium channel